jgi:hypothetical protein
MKNNCDHNPPFDAMEKYQMKQEPQPRYENQNVDAVYEWTVQGIGFQRLLKNEQYKYRRLVQLQIQTNIIRNPHKNSHYAVIRSKTRLKRRNKVFTVDVIGHLLKFNVLKSLCEDIKDGNRAIVRFFWKLLNWIDAENLPDQRDFNENNDKQLSKVQEKSTTEEAWWRPTKYRSNQWR